jgi:hypothetical protein
MSQYPASGILFQNDKKQKETQPDYTGSMEMDPEVVKDLWDQLQSGNERPKASLAGWRKVSKNGKPFLSLRSSLLQERKNNASYKSQAPNGYRQSNQDLDDEVPF